MQFYKETSRKLNVWLPTSFLTSGRDIGDKKTLLTYLKSTPADPTLTLTTEDTHVKIDGDTAVVFGRRIERRRREDNNREGTAYASRPNLIN